LGICMADGNNERDFNATNTVMHATVSIVAAFAANNNIAVDDLPNLIRAVHGAFAEAAAEVTPEAKPAPAAAINKSVHADYIICLEDGKKLKMLKRYLRANHGMSPDAYRKRWGLPADYPMVAPSYAAKRSAFAKKIGLGKGVRHKD